MARIRVQCGKGRAERPDDLIRPVDIVAGDVEREPPARPAGLRAQFVAPGRLRVIGTLGIENAASNRNDVEAAGLLGLCRRGIEQDIVGRLEVERDAWQEFPEPALVYISACDKPGQLARIG